jgi:hypothetical protein
MGLEGDASKHLAKALALYEELRDPLGQVGLALFQRCLNAILTLF